MDGWMEKWSGFTTNSIEDKVKHKHQQTTSIVEIKMRTTILIPNNFLNSVLFLFLFIISFVKYNFFKLFNSRNVYFLLTTLKMLGQNL